jgi:GT2 family glycosyltransferase
MTDAAAAGMAQAGYMVTTKVSVIIVSYNSRQYLQACLGSLRDSTGLEIVVVDNASGDGSAEYVAQAFPDVRLLRNARNLGFGSANNLGAAQASGEYLMFLNPDTWVEGDWYTPLLNVLQTRAEVGIVTPKILMTPHPEHINTCGNDVHFTGFAYLRGWMAHTSSKTQIENVFAMSGAAFMMRKSLFLALGGFDDHFSPAYSEDTDLSWRARLAGWQCLAVPSSVVYHDYKPHFSPQKLYLLERNRAQLVLKNWRWLTLLLLLPALLIGEGISWGYALISGRAHLSAKCRAYGWLVAHWGQIMQARHQIERRVSDHDILQHCSHRLAFSQARKGALATLAQRIFDPFFWLYLRLLQFIVRW